MAQKLEHELSDEQKKAYIQNPDICPYCGEPDYLVANTMEQYTPVEMFREVKCNNCDSVWHEIFKLTAIQEITEDY
jgi:formate dehydrogenase maturation protein FdhE